MENTHHDPADRRLAATTGSVGVSCKVCGLWCNGTEFEWEDEPQCDECRDVVDKFHDLDAESMWASNENAHNLRYYQAAEEWRLRLGDNAVAGRLNDEMTSPHKTKGNDHE